MRFMILVKASAASEAGDMPDESLLGTMADYHEQLAQAGVLLDGSGLHPSAKGWRIRYGNHGRTLTEGPFTQTQELIAGYTLIQVRSREEALEWTRRFPNPAGAGRDAEIEVRQMFELDEFTPGEAIDRMREMNAGQRG